MEHFWKEKHLAEFTEQEWESVCMRCGKCCVDKGADDRKIYFYNRVCDGLDFSTGLCSRYEKRLCADCAKVDMNLLETEPWLLPESCAYRLLLAGKDLPKWHPLISGDPNSVRKAKQTVLDVPQVHSGKRLDKAFEELQRKRTEEKWTLNRFYKEISDVLACHTLRPFEVQDIPQNV